MSGQKFSLAQVQTQAQKLRQRQVQRQRQTAIYVQMQLASLAELPLEDFAARVESEIDANGALEKVTEENDNNQETTLSDGRTVVRRMTDFDPIRSAAQMPDGLDRDWAAGGESLWESLIRQINELELTEKQQRVMAYLVGNLDESGFFQKDLQDACDELLFDEYLEVSVEELEACLRLLQDFEPTGIGARSLQECLLLQVRNPEYTSPYRQVEERMLEEAFDAFLHNARDEVAERLDLTDEVVDEVYDDIRHRLDPKPGAALNSQITGMAAPAILPDFRIYLDRDDVLHVDMARARSVRLTVSQEYEERMGELERKGQLTPKEAQELVLIGEKVRSARKFVQHVEESNHRMLRIMTFLAEYQREFFYDGDVRVLRPLVMREVADAVGCDISTVSRMCARKYIDTDFGILPMGQLLVQRVVTKGGEFARNELDETLRELVQNEDKRHPLNDDQLVALMAQRGFVLARRTVAKRRKILNIPAKLKRKTE